MKHHVTSAVIAAIVAFGIGYLPKTADEYKTATSVPVKNENTSKESAYARVMRTKTLRCGYALYAPMLMKDPNTGEMSGIAADVINAVGKSLDLKVEWTAEFGFATSVTDLQKGRFDLTCIGFWRLPLEAKQLTYTTPFLYSQMNPYVRADDIRFDNDFTKINDASIKIVSADGQMTSKVAKIEFPDAQLIELPNMTSMSEQIENIVTKKADVILGEPAATEDYMVHNQGKLKRVENVRPLRVFQNTFAMKMGEDELKTMLDSALIDIIENGEMDRIMSKYDADKKIFKRVSKGYEP